MRTASFAVWFLLLGMLAFADDLEEKRMSLDELDALAVKGDWGQVLFHAEDIVTGDRNARWQAIVEKAAISNLRFLTGASVSGADQMALQMQRDYPFLLHSASFRAQRNETGLASYRQCLKGETKPGDCAALLLAFAEGDKEDEAFQVQAGHLVAEKEDPVASLPFFEMAIARAPDPVKEKLCADPGTRNAILAGLRLGQGELENKAARLADKDCWASVRAELEATVDREPAAAFSANVCPLLKAHGELSGARLKKCPETKSRSE